MGSSLWIRLTRRRVLVFLTLAAAVVCAWMWLDVRPAPVDIQLVLTSRATPPRPPRTVIKAPVEARLDEPDADSGEPRPTESARQVAERFRDSEVVTEYIRQLICDLRGAFPAADQFDRVELKFEPIDPANPDKPKLGGSSTFVIDGIVVSSIPAGPWQAVAVLENAVELRIRWNEVDINEIAECTSVEVTGQLSGVYLTPTGEPLAGGKLMGCGKELPLVDNKPIWIAIPPEPCKVGIEVRHRGRMGTGPSAEVVPSADKDVEVSVPWPLSSDIGPYTPGMMMTIRFQLKLFKNMCGGDLDQCTPFLQEEVDKYRDELAAAEAVWIEEEGAVPHLDLPYLE